MRQGWKRVRGVCNPEFIRRIGKRLYVVARDYNDPQFWNASRLEGRKIGGPHASKDKAMDACERNARQDAERVLRDLEPSVAGVIAPA